MPNSSVRVFVHDCVSVSIHLIACLLKEIEALQLKEMRCYSERRAEKLKSVLAGMGRGCEVLKTV